jgi:uncharacterized membrane protein YhaH (DUF805 family)
MTFQDAVRTVLTQKYADFSGRARRSEYWFWVLFYLIVQAIASIIDNILGTRNSSGTGLVTSIASLALLVPWLAVSARRLHDTGRSGWWTLLWIIPIVGWIILIVWWAQDSQGENKYGPSPKGYGQEYLGEGGSAGYGQGYPGQGYQGQVPPGQVPPGQVPPGQAYPGQSYPGQAYPGESQPEPGDPGQRGYPAQPPYPSRENDPEQGDTQPYPPPPPPEQSPERPREADPGQRPPSGEEPPR